MCFVCVTETSRGYASFTHTNTCLIEKTVKLIIIFGGYKFVCLPPYISNFRYFEIKSPVLRTSNFRDSTVHNHITDMI